MCLANDAAAAMAAARAVIPRYVLHPAAPRLFGAGLWLEEARKLTLTGDRTGAAEQVPQEVADAFVARGDAARCAARVEQYRTAGIDLPVLFPMPAGQAGWDYESAIASLRPDRHERAATQAASAATGADRGATRAESAAAG